MTDSKHIEILRRGPRAWNAWRRDNPSHIPNLDDAALSLSERQLGPINGGPINLRSACMQRAFFRSANLSAGDLESADLSEANLAYARLDRANLKGANLQGAVLDYADFNGACSWTRTSVGRACSMPKTLLRLSSTIAPATPRPSCLPILRSPHCA